MAPTHLTYFRLLGDVEYAGYKGPNVIIALRESPPGVTLVLEVIEDAVGFKLSHTRLCLGVEC